MSIICRFRSAEGEGTGPQLDVPVETTAKELALILNKLLASDEVLPYSFYVGGEEVATTLGAALGDASVEQVLEVTYVPQAVFRVKSVTRCTSTLAGHADAILHVTFSPDGRHLATGSGDATVRLWDLTTETPRFTLRGHGDWVLCTAWSPDGRMLATGGKDGTLFVWDAVRGRAAGPGLSGHRKFLTALSWEPMHSNARCELLASASKDLLIKLWNWRTGRCLHQLSGHTASVTCLRWGGQGLIYSGAPDSPRPPPRALARARAPVAPPIPKGQAPPAPFPPRLHLQNLINPSRYMYLLSTRKSPSLRCNNFLR